MDEKDIEEWVNYLEKPIGDFMYYELDIDRKDQWKVWAAIYWPLSAYILYRMFKLFLRASEDPEAFFLDMMRSMADGLWRFASFVGALVEGFYAHTIGVAYGRWCQRPFKGICNSLQEAMAALPAPEPGFVPGGFQQDVNEHEFRVLAGLRAIDAQARKDTENTNARLVTELGKCRASVAFLESKLEEAEKRVEEANKRAVEAEKNQVINMIVPGRQKARPGRPPFEKWPFGPSPPVADEVVTPSVLGRLRNLERELEVKEAEIVDLLEGLAKAKKTAPVVVAVPAPVVVDTTEVGVQTDDLPLPEKEVEVASPVYADKVVQTDLPLIEEVSSVVEKTTQTEHVDTTDAGIQADLVPVSPPACPSPASPAAAPVLPAAVPAATVPATNYEELVEELQAAKAAMESREAEARSLRAGLDELHAQIQLKTGELATAQNAIGAVSQELTESQARFGSLEHAYHQTVGTLGACDQARQAAVARVSELQTANDQGNAELARQGEVVARLQQSLEAASQGHLQLEGRFQAGRQQFEAGNLRFEELKKQYDEEVAEKAARSQEREKLVAAGRKLEADNRALALKVEALEWSGRKLAKEMRDAQAASVSKDEEIRRLREQGPGQTGAMEVDVEEEEPVEGGKSSSRALVPAAALPLPQTPAGSRFLGSLTPASTVSSAGRAGAAASTPRLGESPLLSRPRPSPSSRGVIETYQHLIDDLTRKNKALAEEKAAAAEEAEALREAKDGLDVELALLKELHAEDELEAQAEMRAQLDQHRVAIGDMEWQLRTKEIDLTVASNKMEVARIQFEAEKRAVDELRSQVGGSDPQRQDGARKGKRVASESNLALKEAKKPMTEESGPAAQRVAQWALAPAPTAAASQAEAQSQAQVEEEEEEVSEEE
ncbi:hypothetical protein A1O1_00370 [Capronia coronata CBS 617.96]|uniref:Uncharacterized protein n=1 Tax=Capronia coronata CBS 617.96 TaxID=1182541 RepID=W9YZW7_9EURO|nr:uncharacterized protein A1O1_00370 [Capronia coronata CBS 617.96]EXJ95250.1 hypothetical protein A1O1_00370 [Capronia coronata CBS 617.96]